MYAGQRQADGGDKQGAETAEWATKSFHKPGGRYSLLLNDAWYGSNGNFYARERRSLSCIRTTSLLFL